MCEFRTSMVKAINFLEDDVFIGETYDEDDDEFNNIVSIIEKKLTQ
mgnify:CR=1 FL=1